MLTYVMNLPELTTFSMNMNMLTGASIHRFIEVYTERRLAKEKWEKEMAEMERIESSSIGSSVASTLKSIGGMSRVSGKSENLFGGSQLGSFLGSIRGSIRGSMKGSIKGSVAGGSVAGGASVKDGGGSIGSVHGGIIPATVDIMPMVNEDDRPISELIDEDHIEHDGVVNVLPSEVKPDGGGDGDVVPPVILDEDGVPVILEGKGEAEAKVENDAMVGEEELKHEEDEEQKDQGSDFDPNADVDPMHTSEKKQSNTFGLQNLQIIDFRNNNLNLDDGWYLLNAFDGHHIMELNGIRLNDIRTEIDISLIDLEDQSIRAAEIMILVLLLRDINLTTHHIHEINLSHNAIDAQTCEFLVESLVDLTHIHSVDLSYNPITNEEKSFVSIQKLSQLLRQTNHLQQVLFPLPSYL